MTKDHLAALLDGQEYPLSMSRELEATAKANGLVVIYGASDDLMEFSGAIRDEIGAYEGTTAYLHSTDILQPHQGCECEYCGYKALKKQCAEIKAVWHDNGDYSWTFTTKIPHAEFDIVEEGEKYCRGIVISTADLPVVKVK
jgi:hypothetical protein